MARNKEGFLDPEPAVYFYHKDGSSQYKVYQESNTGERLPLPFRIEASDIASRFFAEKAVYLRIKNLFYVEVYINGKLESTLTGTTTIYDGLGSTKRVNGSLKPVYNGIWKRMFEVNNSFILIKNASLIRKNQGVQQILNSMKQITNQVNANIQTMKTNIQTVNRFVHKEINGKKVS
jgi:hypothetical protein